MAWGGWGKCEVLGCFTAWRLPGAGFRAEAGEQVGNGRMAGATTAGSAELVTSVIGMQTLDPVTTEPRQWVWCMRPLSDGVSEEPQMHL